MAKRNRTAAQLREDRRARKQSPIVESYNDLENRRERERFHSAAPINPRIKARQRFYSTLPIIGFLYWFKISNHYVELSRHTDGKYPTMTAIVCARMGTPSEAYA